MLRVGSSGIAFLDRPGRQGALIVLWHE